MKIAKPLTAIREWPDALGDLNAGALAIAVVTLVIAISWPRRLRRVIPPTVAGLICGTLLSVIWLGDVPTIVNVPTGLPEFQQPVFALDFLASSLVPALTIALLSTVRGLLSSLAVDAQTRTQHDADRGLLSLGAGNARGRAHRWAFRGT